MFKNVFILIKSIEQVMTVRNIVQGQILFESFVKTLGLLSFLLYLRSDDFRCEAHFVTGGNTLNWRKGGNIEI
jgi:hypothetical protein